MFQQKFCRLQGSGRIYLNHQKGKFYNQDYCTWKWSHSKWIKGLNIRPETIKLLEENIGRTLDDINHSKILYDPLPRVMGMKTRINKWDLIKLKSS